MKKRVYFTRVHLSTVREGSALYLSKNGERTIGQPEDVVSLVRPFFKGADREIMVCLHLNVKNEPVAMEKVAVGTLSTVQTTAREVFKGALLNNASAIILVHNHPAGGHASAQDAEFTEKMCRAGKVIGVKVLDHVVICPGRRSISLKEEGLIS